MLGVFLGILKIIGITILVILLIIIALLLIVLFVPIRYKAHAVIDHCNLDDENLDFKEKVSAEAGFTWLLHLVRGGIGYPENKEFWVKVLFFKILPKSEDSKKKKEEKQHKKDRKNSKKKLEQALENAGDAQEIGPEDRKDVENGSASNEADSANGGTLVSGNSSEDGSTTDDNASNSVNSEGEGRTDGKDYSEGEGRTEGKDYSEGKDRSEGKDHSESEGNPESTGDYDKTSNLEGSSNQESLSNDSDKGKKSGRKKSSRLDDLDDDGVDIFTVFDFFEKLSDLFWGTLDFLEKPEMAVEKAFYTISRACDKIDLIQDTLESPTFERAYRCAKKDLFLILRHVKPKKLSADILLGLGDPATTAQVLAAVNIADAFLSYDIDLEPDFENKVVEADVDIKGKIALWRVLLSAARVYFNKDIRKVWKRINRIISK
ncbi:Protein of unknown function [Butyrivibrio fibrisolvens DSM 3071]|uniref:DUF2953 domain-containing protein n=1 Tax=Butyrivibrio fibrisolvens DSM 3071 TaxID=1121131 RepID=A0A1M5ZFW6_BUTFI|nr:DUF2953 domain-containing protein [Butyrivibrio fibrisolvens]SHI23054.1 Protein of unknown function [Butyrivibrio fibrisolvens DSM 3071]